MESSTVRDQIGSWEVQRYAGGDVGVASYDATGAVEIITDHVWDTGLGALAKATLIAAAPDLYAALQVAQWYVQRECIGHTPPCDCDPCREYREVRDVLARVAGGASWDL